MMQLKPTNQDCEHLFENDGCLDYSESRTKDQAYLFEKRNLSITEKKGGCGKSTLTFESSRKYKKFQIRYLFTLVVLFFIPSLVAIGGLTTHLRKIQTEQEIVRKERNLQSKPTGSSICQANELLCGNGKDCYDSHFECDGLPDCPDNSDEDNCRLPPTCPEQATRCQDGTCVNYHELCHTQIDSLSIKTSLQQTVETTSSTRHTLAVSDFDSVMSDSLQVSSKYTSSEKISEKTITSIQGILMTSSVMADLTSSIDRLASTKILVDTLPMVLNADVTPTAVIRTSLSDSRTTSGTTELVLSSMSTVPNNSDFTSPTVAKPTPLHHSTISAAFSDSRTQTPLPTDAAFSLSTSFIIQTTQIYDSKQLSSSTESVGTQSISLTKGSSSLEISHLSSLPLDSITATITAIEMSTPRSIELPSFAIHSDVNSYTSDSSTIIKSIDTAILSDKSSTFSDTSVFPTASDLVISPTSSIRGVSVTETSDYKSSSATSTDSHISEKIQILSSSFDETLSSLTESTELKIQTQCLSDRNSVSTLTMTFPESSLSFDSFTDTTIGIEMSYSISISSSSLISSDVKSSQSHFSTPMKSVNSAYISDKLSTFSDTHMFAASSDVVISPTSSKRCASVIETLHYKSSSKASTVNHISDEIQILSSSFDETFSSLMESTASSIQTQSLSDRKYVSTLIITTFPESSLSFDSLTDTTTSTGIILSSSGYISSSSLLISSGVEYSSSYSSIAIQYNTIYNAIASEKSSTFSDTSVFPTASDLVISPTSSIRGVTVTSDYKSSSATSTVSHISEKIQILSSSFDEKFSSLIERIEFLVQTQSLSYRMSASTLTMTTFSKSSLPFDSFTDTTTGIEMSSSISISSSSLISSDVKSSQSHFSTPINSVNSAHISDKLSTFSDTVHLFAASSDVVISATSSKRSASVIETLEYKSSSKVSTVNHISDVIQILSSSLDEKFSSLMERTESLVQTQSLSDRNSASTLVMTAFPESSLSFDLLTDTTASIGILLSSSSYISSSSLLISSGVESSPSHSSTAIQSVDNSISSEESSTFSDAPVFPTSSDVLILLTSSIRSAPVTVTLDSKSSVTTSIVISNETQILLSSFDETFSGSEIGSKESTIQTQSLADQTSSSTLMIMSFSESSKMETTSSTLSFSSSVFILYSSRTNTSLESESTVMPISTATLIPTTNVKPLITTIVTSLSTVSVSSTSLGNQTTTHAPCTDEPFPGWLIAVIVCGSVIFLYFVVLIFLMIIIQPILHTTKDRVASYPTSIRVIENENLENAEFINCKKFYFINNTVTQKTSNMRTLQNRPKPISKNIEESKI